MEGEEQWSASFKFGLGVLICSVQECLADSYHVGLEFLNSFHGNVVEDTFDLVEFSRVDTDTKLRPVEDRGKSVVRSLRGEDRDTTSVDCVADTWGPA